MKPQPFNLELWLHLGKPDCVWTRGHERVIQLKWHENARNNYHDSSRAPVLSGLVCGYLMLWNREGKYDQPDYESLFSGNDLMLHLEDKDNDIARSKVKRK